MLASALGRPTRPDRLALAFRALCQRSQTNPHHSLVRAWSLSTPLLQLVRTANTHAVYVASLRLVNVT